jgi:hypothetical protein
MYSISEITQIHTSVEELYMDICNDEYEKISENLPVLLPKATSIMTEFIGITGKLKECGVDIPIDVLTAQLSNLLDAFQNKDMVMLSDTLHYEIADTLLLYIEIRQEMEKENICFD